MKPEYLRELAERLRDPEQYVDACDEAANALDPDAIDSVAARIVEWQPIETAPPNIDLWLYDRAEGQVVGSYTIDPAWADGGYWSDGTGLILIPSHWRPLPEPPTTENT